MKAKTKPLPGFPAEPAPSSLATIRSAADISGVAEELIRAEVFRGKIRTDKVNGVLHVDLEAVLALAELQRRQQG